MWECSSACELEEKTDKTHDFSQKISEIESFSNENFSEFCEYSKRQFGNYQYQKSWKDANWIKKEKS